MSGFLIDTNCVSEIVRLRPDPNVIRWLENANEQSLYLSVLTLGEIRKGIAAIERGRRHAELDAWLTINVRQRFAGRILPVDAAVAERWGQLIGLAKQAGKTIPVVDSLLAATALHHNLTVVSRNVADFKLAQVAVINPWDLLETTNKA
ncbi:MAG: type II toxin-antitoxin system VapC family toxin [Acidobacteriota bacterium]|nr:type II toxin-antitoxin system VapC family toxin [Acidobacteriota bacterium]